MSNYSSEVVRVQELIPSALHERSEDLIALLRSYYEYLNDIDQPSEELRTSVAQRDVWRASEDSLDKLFTEYGFGWVQNRDGFRELIVSHLDEIYKAKGSDAALKTLFRVLTGAEATTFLPKDETLRPSDGKWAQNFYVIAKLDTKYVDVNTLTGNWVNVETNYPGKTTQNFEVEILDVNLREGDVYELQVSRYHSSMFYWDSIVTYNGIQLTVLPAMSQIAYIDDGGFGFKPGDTSQILNYKRNTSYETLLADDSTIATNIMAEVGYLYEKKKYSRRYLADKKSRRYDTEQITRWFQTDGTRFELIQRNDLILRRAIRGYTQIDEIYYSDGTVSSNIKSLQDPYKMDRYGNQYVNSYYSDVYYTDDGTIPSSLIKAYDPPKIDFNWDDLILGFVEIAKGNLTRYTATAQETDLAGIMYGDFNQDGVIDEKDIILLIRRAFGVSVFEDEGDNDLIRLLIDRYIDLLVERGVEFTLEVDTGEAASVTVSGTNAGVITDMSVSAIGWNFPELFFTFVPSPSSKVFEYYVDNGHVYCRYTADESNEVPVAEVVAASRPVGAGNPYYEDNSGFLSNVDKLHDGYYYQEFSYAVETDLTPAAAESYIKQTVHPAGMEVFARQRINTSVELNVPTMSSAPKRNLTTIVGLKYIDATIFGNVVANLPLRAQNHFLPDCPVNHNGDLGAVYDYGDATRRRFEPYVLFGYTVDDIPTPGDLYATVPFTDTNHQFDAIHNH